MTQALRRELALMVPIGLTLGCLKFFEPTESFFEAMTPFQGLPIIDVGAGVGHVAQALRDRGFVARAIDIAHRDGGCAVEIANGVDYRYPADSVALFCRPCHGPYFMEQSLIQAQAVGASTAIYVGFGKNIAHDTGALRRRFLLAARRVGRARESLWLADLRKS